VVHGRPGAAARGGGGGTMMVLGSCGPISCGKGPKGGGAQPRLQGLDWSGRAPARAGDGSQGWRPGACRMVRAAWRAVPGPESTRP
jgi:hypothetical protein